MVHPVLFSSASCEWETPQALFDRLDAVFSFTLDPCATPLNAKCQRFFTSQQDGLSQDWDGERVFMNPPYGRAIGAWMAKAATARALVVCLVPVRTDTRWWQESVIGGGGIVYFIPGRLRFSGAEHAAPFSSALVIFTGHALAGGALSIPQRMSH